jgi:beta-glucosidase
VRQLVDFTRVALEPGEERAHTFDVALERLAYTWPDGQRGVEAGDVTLMVGLSSADIRDASTVAVPELVFTKPERLCEEALP